MFPARFILTALLFTSSFTSFAFSQVFDLVVPGENTHSVATMRGNQLVIDHNQQTTTYDRDSQFDNNDFMGFSNSQVRQAVRFPLSGQGTMQVGRLTGLGVRFRESEMVVKMRHQPTPVETPPYAFGANRYNGTTKYTIRSPFAGGEVLCAPAIEGVEVGVCQRGAPDTQFRMVSQGNGCYQIALANHPEFCIGVETAFGVPAELQVARRSRYGDDDPSTQFVVRRSGGRVTLVSKLATDRAMCVDADPQTNRCNLTMTEFTGEPCQQFQILPASDFNVPPVDIPTVPSRRLISQRQVKNAGAETATIELRNTHQDEIWVLVTDRIQPGNPQRIKIPAGKSKRCVLHSDPGSKIVKTYAITGIDGTVQQETTETAVPGQQRYSISVYQLAAQSVYIDATVPNSQPQVERSPMSVGFFKVPAKLNSGSSDVYKHAKSQNNSGGVQRIDPKKWGLQSETRYRNAFDRLIGR